MCKDQARESTVDWQTSEQLSDRYLLTRRIGAGGMGVVYEARDIVLERPVAVKLF